MSVEPWAQRVPAAAEFEGRDHAAAHVVEGGGPLEPQDLGDLVGGEQFVAAGGQVLSADLAQSHSETTTQGYGEGAEVSGTLATDAGDPVSGATLCVKLATPGVDPAPSPVGTVETDASGNYSYPLPPGPNRTVLIGYRHDAFQLARELRFYSHVRPTIGATPARLRNGKWVHFSGHLPEPSSRGRVVILQANVKGSKR